MYLSMCLTIDNRVNFGEKGKSSFWVIIKHYFLLNTFNAEGSRCAVHVATPDTIGKITK